MADTNEKIISINEKKKVTRVTREKKKSDESDESDERK